MALGGPGEGSYNLPAKSGDVCQATYPAHFNPSGRAVVLKLGVGFARIATIPTGR